jgi:cell division septal protein FtsQ
MGKVKSRSRLLRKADEERRAVRREKHLGLYLALLFGVAFVLGMVLWLFVAPYFKHLG